MKKKIFILSVIIFLLFPLPTNANPLLQMYFDSLPNNVKTYVLRSNVSINMVDSIDYYIPNGEVNAITYLYPYNAVIDIKNGCEEYLTHEIGHTIDYYNNNLWFWSGTDNFKYIYLVERYNNTLFFYGNGTDNEHEYFAEAFNQYLYNPTNLKKYNPLTYDYIKNVVNILQWL